MSAFFTLDRDGQIPTPYPSSTFTVPQCKFALRAITLTMIHVGTLPVSRKRPAKTHVCKRPACRAMRLGVPPPTANVFGTMRPTANVFGTLRASTAGLCTLFCASRAWSANGRASLLLAAGRNFSCGHVATLPCARAWCAENQRCCRHGGRRDGRWSRRGGGSTRRAPSATGLYQLILIRLLYNLGYPGLSWVVPKHGLSWDILGYLGISRLGVYPMITWGNPT